MKLLSPEDPFWKFCDKKLSTVPENKNNPDIYEHLVKPWASEFLKLDTVQPAVKDHSAWCVGGSCQRWSQTGLSVWHFKAKVGKPRGDSFVFQGLAEGDLPFPVLTSLLSDHTKQQNAIQLAVHFVDLSLRERCAHKCLFFWKLQVLGHAKVYCGLWQWAIEEQVGCAFKEQTVLRFSNYYTCICLGFPQQGISCLPAWLKSNIHRKPYLLFVL